MLNLYGTTLARNGRWPLSTATSSEPTQQETIAQDA